MSGVYLSDIRHLDEPSYQKYLATLPPTLQQEVKKYHQPKDRYRTLMGKILLKNYLEKHSSHTLVDIQKTAYGRPYIKNLPFDFNISHSGDYVVLAVNHDGVIGVDIEKHDSTIEIEDFRMVLRDEEWQEIQDSSDKITTFYRLWTIKEALLKNVGRGLFDNIKAIKIEPQKSSLLFQNKLYHHKTFSFKGYTLSLVVGENQSPKTS